MSIVSLSIILFLLYSSLNKAEYDLEIDAIKDQTDISGIFYRIKISNTGKNQLNDIKVILGKNDVQNLKTLAPGQSFFFYPRPDTEIGKVLVTTKEGISKESDYRSPLKGLGLPGSGR